MTKITQVKCDCCSRVFGAFENTNSFNATMYDGQGEECFYINLEDLCERCSTSIIEKLKEIFGDKCQIK